MWCYAGAPPSGRRGRNNGQDDVSSMESRNERGSREELPTVLSVGSNSNGTICCPLQMSGNSWSDGFEGSDNYVRRAYQKGLELSVNATSKGQSSLLSPSLPAESEIKHSSPSYLN